MPHTPLQIGRQAPIICSMKELFIYGISGLASLFIFGYTVHMFVGGLVSEQTEILLIVAVVLISAAALGYIAWDTMRRRQQR